MRYSKSDVRNEKIWPNWRFFILNTIFFDQNSSKSKVVKKFFKKISKLFHEFGFSWVLVKKYRVLHEKAPIWSYLFVSNVGFSISHDLTSLALFEVIYFIFTQKWPKMGFLWKNRNSCENHKIWSRMVWKWVPHDLNDILGPYHDRISKKFQLFP